MKIERNVLQTCILAAALLALPAVGQSHFSYITNNGTIIITRYTGSGGAVTIPATINGLPVTSIGTSAFAGNSLTSVTSIGDEALAICYGLTSVTIPNRANRVGGGAFNSCTT